MGESAHPENRDRPWHADERPACAHDEGGVTDANGPAALGGSTAFVPS